MTMYYSKAEEEYVEGQRMRRTLEAAARGEIDLVTDDDGIHRYRAKDGKNWQPDMDQIHKDWMSMS